MIELFLPYELAVTAKEKGFNEKCFGFYTEEYKELIYSQPKIHKSSDLPTKPFSAPMCQQIIDWFRTSHDIIIEVAPTFAPKEKYITEYAFSITGANVRRSSAHDSYINIRPVNHWFNSVSEHPKHKKLPVMTASYYEALNKAIEQSFKLI